MAPDTANNVVAIDEQSFHDAIYKLKSIYLQMVHLQDYIHDTHRINEWLAEWEDTANQMRELVQFVEDLEGLTE